MKNNHVEPTELKKIVSAHGRMWPREVFDCTFRAPSGKQRMLAKHEELRILADPGVYILYRDDVPYYIGKASRLRSRLFSHARRPGSKHDLFWNYFSVFVVKDPIQRASVEALLIAAMPTANGAHPKLDRIPYPNVVRQMLHKRRKGAVLKIGEGSDGTEE